MTMPDLLRTRAEDVLRMTRRDFSELSTLDAGEMLHELQVYQLELEMQHEHLQSVELDLEQSKELYEELFDCAPVPYVMLDAGGVIVRANLAAIALFGGVRARVHGAPFAAFVAAADLESLEGHMRAAESGHLRPADVRLRSPRDSVTHVRLDTHRNPGSGSCLVVLTDISARVIALEAEQRLHVEREADLVARIADLEAKNRQLDERLAAGTTQETERAQSEGRSRDADRLQSLGLLAAGVAHDFNNLLVGVLGNADLLLQTPELPESWRAPLTVIKRAGRSASDLTRQLLVFAGMGRLSIAPVSFSRIVMGTLDLIRTGLPPGVRVETRIDPDLPSILADRGQVFQVVMNLMTNAIEAVNGTGRITLGLRAQRLDDAALALFKPHTDATAGEFVVLRVEDDGPGIDAAALGRIFDPFFTTKFTGRGLGLATALGIVQSHHGALQVRSKPGEGTRFQVAFPRADKHRDSERPAPDWKGSGSVLLVDDNDMVRKVMCDLLERLGFDVTLASNGAEALEQLKLETRFDLVVLDWLMPDVSGAQVLESLRGVRPELPVILVTGSNIKDLPSTDHRVARVQKPMTMADLRDAVKLLIGQEAALPVSIPPLRPMRPTGG